MRQIIARFLAWLGRAKTPPPADKEEETIYHTLPYPEGQSPDSGQNAAVTKGPEYRHDRK